MKLTADAANTRQFSLAQILRKGRSHLLASIAFLMLLIPISAAAQNSGVYNSVGKAFEELNKAWLNETKQFTNGDSTLTWGNYEIVNGLSFYSVSTKKYGMPCLYDKSTGTYIIPPATKEDQKLAEKHRIEEGRLWPDRMFFLGSGKGSMAGAPKEFDGCIWMEYREFVRSKKEDNKTFATRKAGLFRIVDGKLQEIFTFSPYYNYTLSVYGAGGEWEVINNKKPYISNIHAYIERVIAIPGSNYLARESSHVTVEHQKVGENNQYFQYTKAQLFDYSGKPVSDTVDRISYDNEFIYLIKDGKTKIINKDLTESEAFKDFASVYPVTISGFGGGAIVEQDGKWGLVADSGNVLIPCIFNNYDAVVTAVKTVFKDLSYTIWYNSEAAKFKEKGEFEKTEHFNARIADPALQAQYVEEMMSGSKETYLKRIRPNITLAMPWKYDADNECFIIVPVCKKTQGPALWHMFNLNVPIAEAPAFKEAFEQIKEAALENAQLTIKDDIATIESITFTTPDGKSYTYKAQ